jgi:hypothetical protein
VGPGFGSPACQLRNLSRYQQNQQLFLVAQLLALNDYPAPRFVGQYYAQSVSLVELLTSEKIAGDGTRPTTMLPGNEISGHGISIREEVCGDLELP